MQSCVKVEGPHRAVTHTEDTKSKEKHTFKFFHMSKMYTVTCDVCVSVLEALQTSKSFQNIYKKNQGKRDLLIQRRCTLQPAVVPHFPCGLIVKDEILDISFLKSTKQTVSRPEIPDLSTENLLCFSIKTRGGENIRKPMKNQLQNKVDYVCVYAVKGETIEMALRRDDRFNSKMFSRGVLLSEKTKAITDLSNPVDASDGEQFLIIYFQHQTDSQGSSKKSVKEQSEVPQETSLEEQSDKATSTQWKKRESPEREQEKKYQMKVIQDSKEILQLLRQQYRDLLEVLKEREKRKSNADVQKFFRQEYDKSAQSFSEVKTVKRLMVFSDLVCQIRINGSAKGTGFLLFNRFVLTSAHVVENYLSNRNVITELKAVFSYDDLTSEETGIVVENIVSSHKGKDEMGNYLDFALLELRDDEKVPELLWCCKDPPVRGGVCIIGHPGGGVKQMDPCFIIPKENVSQAGTEHFQQNPNNEAFQFVTRMWEQEDGELHESQIYLQSCFFHGASGSPMFDQYCNLIGIYTGGYVYPPQGKKIRSVIEYGLPMVSILEHINNQCSENPKVVEGIRSLRGESMDTS